MFQTLAVLLLFAAPDPETRVIGEVAYPARLGVSFDDDQPPDGVKINQVVEKSAAAQGGLVTGDVITHLGGVPVTTPEALREVIGTRHSGDKVEVRFRRDGQDRSVRVKLGRPPLPAEVLTQRDPPRVPGGTISGSLKFTGSVESHGNYVLLGAGAVGEDLQFGFCNVFDVRIDDRQDFANLTVGGAVELSGMLYVAKSKLEFKAGDAFEVIRGAKSIKGSFNTVWLPPLADGLIWKVEIDDVARGRDRNRDGLHDVTLVVVKK